MVRYYDDWRPYVTVAERRRNSAREMARLVKAGRRVAPVRIDGRTIARTFWGKAWCENLERYSDFSNRLPRGRTYVRNGSVVDLQITAGQVNALVSGSEIYEVAVKVSAVPDARWRAICNDCSGAIESLVELLQGRLSAGVMARLCQQKTGLFPAPAEIALSCSCPDWASMCKHVAASLYGIGARLDEQPELLFKLRKVSEQDLIAKAGSGLPAAGKRVAASKVLSGNGLSELFGLEMVESGEASAAVKPSGRRRAVKKSAAAGQVASRAKRPKRGAAPATKTSTPKGAGKAKAKSATTKPRAGAKARKRSER